MLFNKKPQSVTRLATLKTSKYINIYFLYILSYFLGKNCGFNIVSLRIFLAFFLNTSLYPLAENLISCISIDGHSCGILCWTLSQGEIKNCFVSVCIFLSAILLFVSLFLSKYLSFSICLLSSLSLPVCFSLCLFLLLSL